MPSRPAAPPIICPHCTNANQGLIEMLIWPKVLCVVCGKEFAVK